MSIKTDLIDFAAQHNGWLPGVLKSCVYADWADDALVEEYLDDALQQLRRLPSRGV